MIKVIGWIDYDNFNFATADGTDEEIQAVAQNIRENGYKFGGDDHENYSYCCPLLSNGKALRLSWRNWGYVMAVAYDLKTDKNEYNYILWYMGEYANEKRVLPTYQPISLKDCPKGKTFIYDLSDDEYHAVNNACFTNLVLPVDFYDTVELKTLDVIVFKYKDKVVLETVVNDIRFNYYSISELFEKDNVLLSYPCENTNFIDFDQDKLKAFVKSKYGLSSDRFISICFDIIDDKRNDSEIYV